MEMKEKIIGMLEQIMGKLDDHTGTLDGHTKILDGHTKTLDSHTKILDGHTQKLDSYDSQFKEHGQILRALLAGQELDEIKTENAKVFRELNERMDGLEANIEVLRNDLWNNRSDVYRIKKTMSMN